MGGAATPVTYCEVMVFQRTQARAVKTLVTHLPFWLIVNKEAASGMWRREQG